MPKKISLRKIKIPTTLDIHLAELCGIHIGDGHLGFRPKKYEYLVQCTGNLRDDKPYYDQHIKKIWKEIFDIDLKFRTKKDNTYELRVFNKSVAIFMNEFLGLPFGKKSRTIGIPRIIKETCKEDISSEMKACLRGIIDTDFYFVLDRKSPELGAWFASKTLVEDLYQYLTLCGLTPKIRLDVVYYNKSSKKELLRHQIRIRRKEDIKKWFETIGTNNPKIYKRYLKFMRGAPVV